MKSVLLVLPLGLLGAALAAFVGHSRDAGASPVTRVQSHIQWSASHSRSGHAATRASGSRLGQAQAPPSLGTVPAWILADRGVSLDATAATPGVSKDELLTSISSRFGNRMQVRESPVLAFVGSTDQPQKPRQLDWVVSMMPEGGRVPAADHMIQVKYYVALFDAQTGQFLYGIGGGPVVSP